MSETKWRPLDVCCLIKIKKPQEKSAGGIILSERTQREDLQAADMGWIVKKGSNAFQDILEEELKPKIGQQVQFVRHSGRFVEIEQETDEYEFKFVPDKDIFGVLDEE